MKCNFLLFSVLVLFIPNIFAMRTVLAVAGIGLTAAEVGAATYIANTHGTIAGKSVVEHIEERVLKVHLNDEERKNFIVLYSGTNAMIAGTFAAVTLGRRVPRGRIALARRGVKKLQEGKFAGDKFEFKATELDASLCRARFKSTRRERVKYNPEIDRLRLSIKEVVERQKLKEETKDIIDQLRSYPS